MGLTEAHGRRQALVGDLSVDRRTMVPEAVATKPGSRVIMEPLGDVHRSSAFDPPYFCTRRGTCHGRFSASQQRVHVTHCPGGSFRHVVAGPVGECSFWSR